MRKVFSAMAALAVFSAMTAAFASVPDAEVSIGGIPYGASMDYVRSIYGAPAKVSTTSRHPLWRGQVDTYHYGTTMDVVFCNTAMVHADCRGNNGWGTPAGITVGMTKETVLRLYGEPDSEGKGSFFYQSESNGDHGIKFMFDDAGKIKSIHVGAFD